MRPRTAAQRTKPTLSTRRLLHLLVTSAPTPAPRRWWHQHLCGELLSVKVVGMIGETFFKLQSPFGLLEESNEGYLC